MRQRFDRTENLEKFDVLGGTKQSLCCKNQEDKRARVQQRSVPAGRPAGPPEAAFSSPAKLAPPKSATTVATVTCSFVFGNNCPIVD